MSLESGRVIGIEAHCLWVETVRRSSCGSCVAQKGCGQGLMNRLADGRRNQLRVSLGEFVADDFQLDDEVDISIPDRVLLGATLVVYLLPLLSLLAGMVIATQYSAADGPAALGAGLGFVLGLGLVRLHAGLVRARPAYQPRVVDRRPGRPTSPQIIQPGLS